MKFKKPKFWDLKKPNFISYFLLPLTLPLILNNFFLRFKPNQENKLIKTVCVGNIYLGGTGKTPTVIKIYQILKDLKFKVSTAKKFYDSQHDENIILEKKTNFLTANKRKEIIDKALKNQNDFVIFDDGLQDKTIKYDLQFVCFEGETFIGNGCLIPSGPLREKLSSLKKYDCAFIKNSNGDKIDNQISLIKKYNNKIEIFETYLEINNLEEFDQNKNFLIFSGIGNHLSFKRTLEKYNFKIIKEIVFPDHYKYSKKEIESILLDAEKNKAKVITTYKDFVKIANFGLDKIKFIDIDLKIKNEKDFINFLKKRINEKS